MTDAQTVPEKGSVLHLKCAAAGAMSLDAMMNLDRVAEFIERIVIQRDLVGLEDEDERWHAEAAADRCRSQLPFLEDKFLRGSVNKQFRARQAPAVDVSADHVKRLSIQS